MMTYSYNAVPKSMADYIVSQFKVIKVDEDVDKIRYLRNPKDSIKKYVTFKDIYLFIQAYTEVFSEVMPRAEMLKKFFKDVVELCSELDI